MCVCNPLDLSVKNHILTDQWEFQDPKIALTKKTSYGVGTFCLGFLWVSEMAIEQIPYSLDLWVLGHPQATELMDRIAQLEAQVSDRRGSRGFHGAMALEPRRLHQRKNWGLCQVGWVETSSLVDFFRFFLCFLGIWSYFMLFLHVGDSETAVFGNWMMVETSWSWPDAKHHPSIPRTFGRCQRQWFPSLVTEVPPSWRVGLSGHRSGVFKSSRNVSTLGFERDGFFPVFSHAFSCSTLDEINCHHGFFQATEPPASAIGSPGGDPPIGSQVSAALLLKSRKILRLAVVESGLLKSPDSCNKNVSGKISRPHWVSLTAMVGIGFVPKMVEHFRWVNCCWFVDNGFTNYSSHQLF